MAGRSSPVWWPLVLEVALARGLPLHHELTGGLRSGAGRDGLRGCKGEEEDGGEGER
jgi:hypothetical protein